MKDNLLYVVALGVIYVAVVVTLLLLDEETSGACSPAFLEENNLSHLNNPNSTGTVIVFAPGYTPQTDANGNYIHESCEAGSRDCPIINSCTLPPDGGKQ